MRVDAKTSAFPMAHTAQTRRASGQRFTLSGSDGASKTSATASAVPLATVDTILALQGEGDPAERRRRSVRRGHDLLDALDRLKAAILSGRVAMSELQQVAARLAQRSELSGDPRLDEVLAHIELRAQVEMAKLAVR